MRPKFFISFSLIKCVPKKEPQNKTDCHRPKPKAKNQLTRIYWKSVILVFASASLKRDVVKVLSICRGNVCRRHFVFTLFTFLVSTGCSQGHFLFTFTCRLGITQFPSHFTVFCEVARQLLAIFKLKLHNFVFFTCFCSSLARS